MSDSVFFIVELEVNQGQTDDLRRVMEEMTNLTQTDEPGTLNYEWFLSDDGRACHIYERYANPAAALVHNKTFPKDLFERSQAFRPIRLTAYGNVTAEIREKRIDPLSRAIPGIRVAVLGNGGGFMR